ncbi:hypothetical protein GCM10023213_34810 [Prosthecobacter algae]|uniref:Glucokinase n=1 Tax=Prosthecobacter algae TaxID=1144682 RepID=A0ABP9PCR5_9BACT
MSIGGGFKNLAPHLAAELQCLALQALDKSERFIMPELPIGFHLLQAARQGCLRCCHVWRQGGSSLKLAGNSGMEA